MNRCFALTILFALALPVGAVTAQEVIPDPGKCTQFYPNANCQNYGPGNPYRRPYSYQQERAYPGLTIGSGLSVGGTRSQINRSARGGCLPRHVQTPAEH